MLLVPHYTGPSPIHGTGLFAVRTIRAGEKIWAFASWFDVQMTDNQILQLPACVLEHVRPYLYEDIETHQWILCSDHAKYMNHAKDANTEYRDGCSFAKRAIKSCEEITCNYREFDARARDATHPDF